MVRASETSIRRLLGMAAALLLVATEAVEAQELRTLNNKFKSEAGCPVEVISAKTSLEIDPVGTPMACRIYIDYKNISAKTLSGVKFRIGYIDDEDKVRGTFHAPDGHVLEPGATASAKWRGEKVDPRTHSIMIRTLVARFSDGKTWESEKMKALAPGTGGDGPSTAGTAEGMTRAPASGEANAANEADKTGTNAGTEATAGGDTFESEGESVPQAQRSKASSKAQKSPSGTDSGTGKEPQMPAAPEPPAPEPSASGNKSDGY